VRGRGRRASDQHQARRRAKPRRAARGRAKTSRREKGKTTERVGPRANPRAEETKTPTAGKEGTGTMQWQKESAKAARGGGGRGADDTRATTKTDTAKPRPLVRPRGKAGRKVARTSAAARICSHPRSGDSSGSGARRSAEPKSTGAAPRRTGRTRTRRDARSGDSPGKRTRRPGAGIGQQSSSQSAGSRDSRGRRGRARTVRRCRRARTPREGGEQTRPARQAARSPANRGEISRAAERLNEDEHRRTGPRAAPGRDRQKEDGAHRGERRTRCGSAPTPHGALRRDTKKGFRASRNGRHQGASDRRPEPARPPPRPGRTGSANRRGKRRPGAGAPAKTTFTYSLDTHRRGV